MSQPLIDNTSTDAEPCCDISNRKLARSEKRQTRALRDVVRMAYPAHCLSAEGGSGPGRDPLRPQLSSKLFVGSALKAPDELNGRLRCLPWPGTEYDELLRGARVPTDPDAHSRPRLRGHGYVSDQRS